MRRLGWTPLLAKDEQGLVPSKVVLAVYPHTSNRDFPIGMLWKWATHAPVSFVAKRELFRFPLGLIIQAFGGIAVDRSKAGGNFVEAVANLIKESQEIVVAIAPEGTRSYAHVWKTGFYYMALAGKVPLALGTIDWGKKQVGIMGYFYPTGDITRDLRVIKEHFENTTGYRPENQGAIMLLDQ